MSLLQAEFAIIGGTGVYDPALLEEPVHQVISTPYGQASATLGTYRGKRVAFMPRHGAGHSIPPHKINYRANIMALKQLGVKQVFASAAVGSLQLSIEPGSLMVVDSFLDFTKSRTNTFFEADKVVHVDMSDPYCGRLRQTIHNAAGQLGIPLHEGGAYVCTEGPRFETTAEIKLYQSFGASVVGMTSVPEVVLAKEAELCYATVCMVTNYGAGISTHPLTHDEVVETMAQNVHQLRNLFFRAIELAEGDDTCACRSAVGGQAPLTGLSSSEERAGSQ